MYKQRKSRYMTRTVNERLNIETQVLLWEVLDMIIRKRKDKMDYLQVFEISNSGNKIRIINRQEQSVVIEELIMVRGFIKIEDTIIWIIDEVDK